MKPADRAWLVLVAAITAYEITAARKGWELLSEAMDRYRAEDNAEVRRGRRRIINGGIGYLYLHLTRRIPPPIDPLTRLADWLSSFRR